MNSSEANQGQVQGGGGSKITDNPGPRPTAPIQGSSTAKWLMLIMTMSIKHGTLREHCGEVSCVSDHCHCLSTFSFLCLPVQLFGVPLLHCHWESPVLTSTRISVSSPGLNLPAGSTTPRLSSTFRLLCCLLTDCWLCFILDPEPCPPTALSLLPEPSASLHRFPTNSDLLPAGCQPGLWHWCDSWTPSGGLRSFYTLYQKAGSKVTEIIHQV